VPLQEEARIGRQKRSELFVAVLRYVGGVNFTSTFLFRLLCGLLMFFKTLLVFLVSLFKL
jgi:hypothetical protein